MKKIFAGICAIVIAISLCGCNKQFVDTTYKINYAIIKTADGEIVEGKVKSWTDFEDGDTIQIKFEDYGTYIVHMSNATLKAE